MLGRRSNAVISAFNWTIHFHCDEFRNFIDFNEEHFKLQENEVSGRFKDVENNYVIEDDFEQQEYLEHLKDMLIDEAEQLRKFEYRYRESVLIQVCSFLEIELRRFCSFYAHIHNKKDEYNQCFSRNGAIVDCAKKYLKLHANIDLAVHKQLCTFINNMLNLRHHIVHHGNQIKSIDRYFPSVNTLAKGNFTLKMKIKDWYDIRIDNPRFLLNCIDNVETMLEMANDTK